MSCETAEMIVEAAMGKARRLHDLGDPDAAKTAFAEQASRLAQHFLAVRFDLVFAETHPASQPLDFNDDCRHRRIDDSYHHK
jgi:hypothetical protein